MPTSSPKPSCPFDLAELQSLVGEPYWSRGRQYAKQGNVQTLHLEGRELDATVQGSHGNVYSVRIAWDDQGQLTTLQCTCSMYMEWGLYCEHIAAAALVACGEGVLSEAQKDALAQMPRRELLGRLSAADLRELWQQLALAASEFDDLLRLRFMAKDATNYFSRSVLAQAVDTFVHYALERDPLAGVWSWAIHRTLRELLRQGHPRSLEALATVTDALLAIPDWYRYGYVQGQDSVLHFAEELGWIWARAMLTLPLTQEERRKWTRWLKQRKQIAEQGSLDWYSLERAIEAAEEGWDAEPIRRALAGEATGRPTARRFPWTHDDELDRLRFEILLEQGRRKEAENWARVRNLYIPYLRLLLEDGRLDELMQAARDLPLPASQALDAAKMLWEAGHRAEALDLAVTHWRKIGTAKAKLDVLWGIAELARWIWDHASILGREDLARDAAAWILQHTRPSLDDYQAYRSLFSAADWLRQREQALAWMRANASLRDTMLALAEEGLLAEAMRMAEIPEGTHAESAEWEIHKREELMRHLLPYVQEEHPEWVAKQAWALAEALIGTANSAYYELAVRWLAEARRAYARLGREAEWQARLDDLVQRHRRKRSLKRLLRERGWIA
ncbi:MAG: hypothetical protein GXO36_00605 [Chloroflexi bacterium]|nr:hypothetical protein [Chloroflexota bacterium]